MIADSYIRTDTFLDIMSYLFDDLGVASHDELRDLVEKGRLFRMMFGDEVTTATRLLAEKGRLAA
jgi:hypothetical protein